MTNLKHVKIYRYLDLDLGEFKTDKDLERAPITLNYKTHLTRSLFPHRTFVKGELQQICWYASYDQETEAFSDLVIKIDVVYERTLAGYALSRTTTRTWIAEDDSEAEPVKTTKKYYIGKERDVEGVKRRGNIVEYIKAVIGFHLMKTDTAEPPDPDARLDIGREFYASLDLESRNFINVGKTEIISAIAAAGDTWLDDDLFGTPPGAVTVRNFVLSELSI